ncbi:hypothetical protein BV22DRAFT_1032756 [Leucogyrophana mollusca]|uniref:Uncharacterized protein n=1 Tax=Leucogyrophana mollusca TaxID=85980 RepID=A0ACB8BKZ6_9AGAM|nr:hypothetical protein BV22DRAFT_1032756 [Leucogyrophana mollusca]
MSAILSSPVALVDALFGVRIASPALVLLAALSLVPTKAPTPPSPSPITPVVVESRVPRRALILALLSIISASFFVDGLAYIVNAIIVKWPRHTGIECVAVTGLVAYGGLAALGAWKDVRGVEVWTRRRVKVAIGLALVLDIVQLALLASSFRVNDPDPRHICSAAPNKTTCITDVLHIALAIFRVLLLIPFFFTLLYPRVIFQTIGIDEEEVPAGPTDSNSLLHAEDASGSKYGTFASRHSYQRTNSSPTTRATSPAPGPMTGIKKSEQTEVALDPSWSELYQRIRRLTPYLWPTHRFGLQFIAFICILLLVLGRVVNALLPLSLGELVRVFDEGVGSPWPYLFAYVVLRFLQSGGGISALRDTLWIPIMQYSERSMSMLSFTHLLNLSLAFHTRRKTGEILRILDRGSAVNRVVELLLFNIAPALVDVVVAVVIFGMRFEWILSAVVAAVLIGYVVASVLLTRYRTKLRRQMNDRDVITRGIHTDCLLNYETVKYFGGEQHESARYESAIGEYQGFEWKVMSSLNLLNLVQTLIITLGLLVGSLIVTHRIVHGQSTTSDFVVFIAYFAQLYAPLNNLGFVYRSINQSLVDTERLLKLLAEPTEINDNPNAKDLIVENGEVEFENVSFSYDHRTTALHGVSFKVPAGSSVALVGESGAGKSTILRLLYRFYDLGPGEGRILIDGQDIRDVSQASLRAAIGVVPQDPVLFNTGIGYNIGYGKFDASSSEIEAAAQAAQMHERIMSFPDGYETKVGERGVRLSGGEKQRVAIARTLLKNPPILLLDEATSALDTSTEKDIQKALQNLQRGRSSLSIAHRLSTIASADLILVLKDGQIVERGSHKELLALDGVFASMWADQITASESATVIPPPAEPVVPTGYDVEEELAAPVENDDSELKVVDPEEQRLVDSPRIIAGSLKAASVAAEPAVEESHPEAPEVPAKDDSAPISFPSADEPTPEPESAPVAFPSPDTDASPAPLAFPTSNDTPTPSQQDHNRSASASQVPGVTFDAGVNTPPRTGTPDPESEPKRKRISSQNFQRLARRISISTPKKVTTASLIPSMLRRDSSTVSAPKDDTPGEGSARNSGESPVGSVTEDSQGSKSQKKKDKERKRKSFMQ